MQPPAHHVAMMQIECEVINTKLIHIKEDAIPLHMMEAQQMMNNKSEKTDDVNDSNENNKNASIESKKGHDEQRQYDDIHSYYQSGYNLSQLNNDKLENNNAIDSRENVSSNEEAREDAFEYEIYANSSNGEYIDDDNSLHLNDEDSPDTILQRSPGIVPRRFNKNAKVREPSFADSSAINQNNNDRDGTINFNP